MASAAEAPPLYDAATAALEVAWQDLEELQRGVTDANTTRVLEGLSLLGAMLCEAHEARGGSPATTAPRPAALPRLALVVPDPDEADEPVEQTPAAPAADIDIEIQRDDGGRPVCMLLNDGASVDLRYDDLGRITTCVYNFPGRAPVELLVQRDQLGTLRRLKLKARPNA